MAFQGFAHGDDYDAARPSYPVAAVEYLVERLEVTLRDHVLDLGAGSGIFTRQLRPFVGSITAVDPSPSMIETLLTRSPDVDARLGRDTAIPLDDASVAAVFAAQAFHWFDVEPALAEMHRVLVPGGGLGLIWNERDESVGWVADLGRAMLWPERQPYVVGTDFSERIRRGPFTKIERRRFSHSQELDHEALYRRVLTTSYISLMEPAEREIVLHDVASVIEDQATPVVLPYVTDVYSARAE